MLELASSTLAMFSSRPGAGAAFAEAGTAAVLIKLLSPLFPPVVVINICNNVGNMAGGCPGGAVARPCLAAVVLPLLRLRLCVHVCVWVGWGMGVGGGHRFCMH